MDYVNRVIAGFLDMPRAFKRTVTALADTVFIGTALMLALVIRVGDDYGRWVTDIYVFATVLLVLLTLSIWVRIGLYRAVIRFLDVRALTTILWGAAASAVLLLCLSFVLKLALPRSVPFIYFAVVLIFVAGSRLLVRGLIQSRHGGASVNVAIYGAGSAGRQLCLALQNGFEFTPAVFVDDSRHLQGASVAGVRVYPPEFLPELINKHHINKVLFAIPSVSDDRKKAIFNRLQSLQVEMLTIPGSAELINDALGAEQLRSIDINDLLGREAVNPERNLLIKCICQKTVLVTGAGGSIGSELCRQIISQGPARLVLLDHSELNLYEIERELAGLLDIGSEVEVVPVLGSVRDKQLLDNLFNHSAIDTVYHAAAYKHVPLVEKNIANGLVNNVDGTKCLTEAALKHKVKHFILISTDKAVRPTNIMGASKRLAELIVQDAAARSESSVFAMVRFGNVLGSSGSVVPLFREQVNAGGPVTVTHSSITRYFMTVPEAASLVIQAGAMATGGEVFVLDMGEPVKVLDLAHKMIHLMGYSVRDEQNPGGDIEVKFTGLRPGEKLFEELLVGENAQGTKHPRIMCAKEEKLTCLELRTLLDQLHAAIQASDFEALRDILITAPLGYVPSGGIADNFSSSGTKSERVGEQCNVTVLDVPRG